MFKALSLGLTVYILYSCIALGALDERTRYAGCGDNRIFQVCKFDGMQPALREQMESLVRARALIVQKRPELAKQLLQAEYEFYGLLQDIEVKYDVATRGWDDRPFNTDTNATYNVARFAIPRQIILSGFGRSAMTFFESKTIIFDYDSWIKASLQEKKLIVLTEYLRFYNIEDEEDRYQMAGEILRISEGNQVADTYANREFNPARESFQVYDKHKIFISQIGENESKYLIVNSQSPVLYPWSCRKPEMFKKGQPMSVSARMYMGLYLLDPAGLAHCQSILLSKPNWLINLIIQKSNNMVTSCVEMPWK